MKPTTDKKSHLSLDGLERMQSVRTTFRFSKKAEEALDRLRKTTKITMKGMLDRFAELFLKDKAATAMLVKEAATVAASHDLGVRKTWVVSKATLTLISVTAQANGLSRDTLAESLVLLADEVIRTAKLQQPEKHKEAQKIIGDFEKQVRQIEDQLGDLLGEDDPIYNRFRFVGTILMNLSFAIDAEIKNGTPVDPDDMAQQG
ncbi:MAG: hypothetical protein C0392_02835 [Syntrophus sp. (in: bacteria)]|nr:hypothetical protein [Syntrophus sp. (in: bacteria)]